MLPTPRPEQDIEHARWKTDVDPDPVASTPVPQSVLHWCISRPPRAS